MNIEGLWKYDKLIKAYEAEVQHNMELEKDYDNLLEELEEYKEKIITARQELEDLKKTRYIWDATRREWLPESGTLQQIQRHVAFPLIAKVGGEIHES